MSIFDPNEVADRLEEARGDRERQHAIINEVTHKLLAHVMTDDELLAAYQRTDGEPGNPEADALAAEIERRNLDV